MTVYLVGAGPGHPGLITRRGGELLESAEVVIHDRLVPTELLELVPKGALRIDVGKVPGHPDGQTEINALLVEHGRAGRRVVRLKGGDPFVFGRGGEEALALRAAGVAYEIIPGVSAAIAVPAYAGVPLTHRGLAASVTVVTGRVGGSSPDQVDWEALARVGGTLVVLMGMERRAAMAQRLVAGGLPETTPVVVVRWGTTPEQVSVRTVLGELGSVDIEAPATMVIGAVAGLDLDWFVAPPLAGVSVVVTRETDRAAGLRQAFAEAGARVVHIPVVLTEDPLDGSASLRRAVAQVRRYDWVVCTSALGVQRFTALLRDGRDLGGVRLGAVGRMTAEAFAAERLVVDLVADPATGEGLVQAMERGPGRVLYPCAEQARDVVGPGLRAKGWEVDEAIAYRTVPRTGADPAELDVAAQADVVTFTSPSTVEAYVALSAGRRVPPVVACIGPVTAEAASRAGLEVAVTCEDPSAEALVAAVLQAVSARR